MMITRKRLSGVKLAAASAVIALGSLTAGLAYASGVFHASAPTQRARFTVYIGGGHNNDDFTNLQYTPDTLNIYTGDTVTFVTKDQVEPHTVTFGPKSTLDKLAHEIPEVVPNKNGPPTLEVPNQVVLATKAKSYNGTGFANSGVLSSDYHGLTKTSWTIEFTKAGTYHYFCLIHYPFMTGTIVVNPRPKSSHLYTVQAGYGSVYPTSPLTADTFFPENLTVRVGDVVKWVADFHTVTFTASQSVSRLRSYFIEKVKGGKGKSEFIFNPADVFPSARNGCGSSVSRACAYSGGFLNSGLLQGTQTGPAAFYVKFTKAGTYRYHCLVHKGMDGKITVVAATKST